MTEYWDLKIWPCYHAVLRGPDHEQSKTLFKDLLHRFSSDPSKRCLQVGVPHCCTDRFAANFVTLDLYDQRPCIDYHEDLAKTSFADNSFDLITCNAILEHVQDPFACAREMLRIAKVGAEIWVEVPFVQPYHPRKDYTLECGYLDDRIGGGNNADHGGDYWRFTPQGLVQLLKGFKPIHVLLVNEGGVMFHGQKY